MSACQSQQRGKRGSPQDEDRFNAQCKVDGLLVPKIWVNIDADTIWLMNWVRTPYRGTIAPMVPTWAKWERCPQASIMRLAMCKAFVGEFFSINPRIRTDKLRLEELFVLYRAEEGVLDADMIWLVEPNQNARFTALSLSRTGRNDNSLEGESFWEQEAALTKNGIQRVCDWYQNAFVDSQNSTPIPFVVKNSSHLLTSHSPISLYHTGQEFLRDLSHWKTPEVQCR